MIGFLTFCRALSTSLGLLVRLSKPLVRLLVFILRGEYFRTPPGGPSRARSITISRLQELQIPQEVTSVVITPLLHNAIVINPVFHDPAGVAMITMRLSLSPSLRKKRLGSPEQPRVATSQALLIGTENHLLLPVSEVQSVPPSDR